VGSQLGKLRGSKIEVALVDKKHYPVDPKVIQQIRKEQQKGSKNDQKRVPQ